MNRRLDDGVEGKQVVAWLNTLPEVREILATEFEERAVSEQNLSQWRKGGYRDWQRQRELLEVTRELSREMRQVPEVAPPAETVAQWVTARYALATRELRGMPPEKAWPRLRAMCADVSALQRGEQAAQSLALRRDFERRQANRIAAREGATPSPLNENQGDGTIQPGEERDRSPATAKNDLPESADHLQFTPQVAFQKEDA